MLLVIDIGGTNTRIAICSPNGNKFSLIDKKNYESKQFNGIEEIISEYQVERGIKAKSIVMGIPAPVTDGLIRPTNLDWVIDKNKINIDFSLSRILILNDVEALGYAIEVLPRKDFKIINKGKHIESAPIAILAPGTGLGESFLISNEGLYKAYSSEGGHCDFAPTNENESKLLFFLKKKYGHVSYERVCSGPGLCNIYEFFKKNKIGFESNEAKKLIIKAPDIAKAISEIALAENQNESVARKTIDLFVSLIGSEAGNLALRYGARNGIYLGGGIIPKILPIFDNNLFLSSFKNKGRFSTYMSDIPVKIICNSEANLYGLSSFSQK